MSYRLIDSNAMQLRHPEVNDMPCIYADLSNGLDGTHYDLRNPRMSDDTRRIVNAIDHLSHRVGEVADNLAAFNALCTVVEAMLIVSIVTLLLYGCSQSSVG